MSTVEEVQSNKYKYLLYHGQIENRHNFHTYDVGDGIVQCEWNETEIGMPEPTNSDLQTYTLTEVESYWETNKHLITEPI